MTLALGSGGNGGGGLEYSGGGKKQGIAFGGPGGVGGIVDPTAVSLFDFYQNGANGADGTPGGYANSMSGYGFPGAGGNGANGYSALGSGGVGGSDPSGSQSYSYGNHVGTAGTGFGGGGGGGSGYGGIGAFGATGRMVVEYSTPIPDPIVAPTISCSATAGVLDTAPFGTDTVLSWSTNTPTTTVLEISTDLLSWTVFPTAPTTVGSCYTVTASTTNALAQTNYFRLTATTTPIVPPLPPVPPATSCDATAGVLSVLPQGLNTTLSWSTNTPTTTVLQLSTDFVVWVNSATIPTSVGGCYTVVASTTSSTGQVNFFRLNTPTVVLPPVVPPSLPSCSATRCIVCHCISTDSILTWATTTQPFVAQRSVDELIDTITVTPPVINNCFSVTASTTDSVVATKFLSII